MKPNAKKIKPAVKSAKALKKPVKTTKVVRAKKTAKKAE